jgi:branched-chain amino acid transport system ATP-binding protein
MLEVTELEVRYGAVHAVRGASLVVKPGEIVGLIGPNGAGKTSTVQAICGLVPAQAGTVTYGGQNLAGMSSARRVRAGLALVPQGREVFPNLSVAENLTVGSWIRRPGGPRPKSDELLAEFPALRVRLHQSAGTLSGGEQQMLALARAVASRPSCMLLDEPSMGLSPIMVDRVAQAIRVLAEQRDIAVLVVDQGLGVVRKITSRIYVMVHGRVVEHVETNTVGDGRGLERAYFG